MKAREPALQHCESVSSITSGLTVHTVDPVVSVQHSVCQTKSLYSNRSRHSAEMQKCGVGESCEETKENQQTKISNPNCGLLSINGTSQSNKTSSSKTPMKCRDGNVLIDKNKQTTGKAEIIADNLSSYGFNTADWLNDSFTDQGVFTDTVKPLSCPVANIDNRNTKSSVKIYEDSSRSANQSVVSYSAENSNSKVLCDRTNVAQCNCQIATKTNSPVMKRTRLVSNVYKENCNSKENTSDKSCDLCLAQRVTEIDCGISDKNDLKLLRQSHGRDFDRNVLETCSELRSNISCASVIALSSATVTVTAVTVSCQFSSAMPSSLAVLTSSVVTFHSNVTSAVSGHPSELNLVTYTSPISSIAVPSTAMASGSMKHQPRAAIRSSLSSTSAVAQSYSLSIRTPQIQASVRNSGNAKFSTPRTMVTPSNHPLQNSTMRPTPPMCSCGCRAKRKFVQSPGQNMGRPFYCCGANRRSLSKGCNFFKWENSPIPPVTRSSDVTPLSTKQFTSMQSASSNRNFTTPLSNHSRQARSFRVLVPPS